MRFVVPSVVRGSFSIGLAATVSVIAVLWNVQGFELQRSDSFIESAPADAAILLQGSRMQLDRLSLHDRQETQDNAKTNSSVIGSTGYGSSSNVNSAIGIAAWALRAKLSDLMASRTTGTESVAIVMMVVLLGCTCLALGSMVFPEKLGLNPPPRQRVLSAPSAPRRLSPETALSLQPQSRMSLHSMMPQSPVMSGNSPRPSGLSERNLLHTSLTSPVTSALAATPAGVSLSGTLPRLTPAVPIPALCPSIVMPTVEARFGIPLLEINRLMKYGQGELTVVGLSTNPLLRAVVKRVGNARSLEISMPERNGVPRATLTPASHENSSCFPGATTLEIRGMQSNFYGFLVMTEQATYVTHEGQTVLSIGGQAASLQLVLKSSDGSKAADVRCSSEAFGGQDHVELRVEAAVDTVLVLAVVLSVLLLSPWSADDKK